MQLKRDTELALRILYCLQNRSDGGERNARRKPGLAEISIQTMIPKVTARRICTRLCDSGMIGVFRESERREAAFYLKPVFFRSSLLDVIRAMENTGRIFAVFDRESPMYLVCGTKMEKAEREVEAQLAEVSLESLLKEER